MNRLPGVAHVVSRACLAAPFIAGGTRLLRRSDSTRRSGPKARLPRAGGHRLRRRCRKSGRRPHLAAGVRPELSAAALIANLAPMTVSVHPFWKERDPQKRSIERNAFILNLALAGGLLAVATRGRRR